ncbi:MAG: hypothetical protein HFE63_10705 [Clostridiales bacterium]|nr:hypothetical protein [Clostridiales bacterium]
MKKSKQLASLLLLAAIFTASCADNPPPNNDDESVTSSSGVETENPNDSNGFLKDSLPDDIDLEERVISILGWNHYEEVEFEVEEETGELVSDALYKRNRNVEERFNVKLEFFEGEGRGATDEWMTFLRNSVMSMDGSYDIVACHSHRVASASAAGYLKSLIGVDYIDFNMPWWRKSLLEETTINGELYFAAGDISLSSISRMQGIFFNTEMLTDYNLEDPYELVINGEWTYDKLSEMVTGAYVDLNSNSKKDESDQFGFCSDGVQLQASFPAAGLKMVSHDESDKLIISPLIASERSVKLIEKLNAILHNSNDSTVIKVTDDDKIFREGRGLFYAFPLGMISSGALRDAKFTAGFVPWPKLEESDETYWTSSSNAFSLWAIPLDAPDANISGLIMEAMGSEGYRTVTPALFETAYKVKYNSTDSSYQSEIFDMMRENIVYEIGKIFANYLPFSINQYMDTVSNNRNNWVSTVDSNRNSLQAKLDELEKSFKEFTQQ